MKIRRISRSEPRGFCFDCHNRAEMEVSFGPHRPALRLCMRDARYMSGFMARLIADHDAGKPIPPVKAGRNDDDSRGNR
jgi:hypothetical protein